MASDGKRCVVRMKMASAVWRGVVHKGRGGARRSKVAVLAPSGPEASGSGAAQSTSRAYGWRCSRAPAEHQQSIRTALQQQHRRSDRDRASKRLIAGAPRRPPLLQPACSCAHGAYTYTRTHALTQDCGCLTHLCSSLHAHSLAQGLQITGADLHAREHRGEA